MTALAAERMGGTKFFKTLTFTLASGTKAYKHGLCVLNIGAGTVQPGTATTGKIAIGRFAETVDATLAALPVQVDLSKEIEASWWASHDSNVPGATTVGSLVYIEDDQTVSTNSTGRSVAGRCWAVNGTSETLVEALPVDTTYTTAALAAVTTPIVDATLAFTDADCAVTAPELVHGTVFTCPATAAISTITMAVTDVAVGTQVVFTFDGTANDFDVGIRYGTTVIATVPAGTIAVVRCTKQSATVWTCDQTTVPVYAGAFPAEVGNDVIVTAEEMVHLGVYTLPTLDANSTVTLATTGVPNGMVLFVACASPGAYTVTYRYGTTAISAALTASKAHCATLIKLGSAWYCNVTIGP